MFGNRLIKSNNAGAACTTDTVQILDGVPLESIATYQLDGAATSIPNNTYPGTFTNPAYATGKFGQAAVFNGSSSYIDTNYSTSYQDPISISAWVKTTDTDSFIFGPQIYQNSRLSAKVDGNGKLEAVIGYQTIINLNSTTSINDNNWHHICFTFDGNNGNKAIYVDGVLEDESSVVTDNNTTAFDMLLGRRQSSYLNGSIDQVRIFDTALSAGAVTSLYNETVATASNSYINVPSCIAYYKMSDATDQTGSYDGTPTNVNFNVAGKFGNAGEFNGSSSYIETSSEVVTTNSYSISCWVKQNNKSTDTAYRRIWSQQSNSNKGFYFGKQNNTTDYVYQFGTAFSLDLNDTYKHLVISFDSTGGATGAKTYLNGVLVNTQAYPGFHTNAQGYLNSNFRIGRQFSTFGEYWDGKIDQVRIFNRAITATEVETLYDEVQCIPTIVPTDYFNTVLWTGNAGASNTTSQSITSVGFQPDLVWVKNRDNGNSHVLFDSIRAATNWLNSNNTNQEYSNSFTADASFLSNGFTTGKSDQTNKSGDGIVAWNWKAGGAAVAAGGTNLTNRLVSANPDAGFSIMTYTGSTSDGTIEHGLNAKPELWIFKNLSVAKSWFTLTNIIDGSVDYGFLNTTDVFNNAGQGDATDTILNVNLDGGSGLLNANGQNYVAYAFHSVDGYSKIGSYVGTGASGNSIVTGFRPAFVMVKSSSNNEPWFILDNKRDPNNPRDNRLMADSSALEDDGSVHTMDFNSNGFTLNGTVGNGTNGNNVSYIFMAFAEEVFVPDNFFNDDSTVATYKLDGDAGDDSGNGYNGTASNVTYAAGKFDDAGVFNGSSSKIVLPTSTFSPFTFTISAWCNVSSDTAENTILELFDNQNYPNHTTIVLSAGNNGGKSARFLLRNHLANQYNYNPSGTVTKNVWKHYAMTYDGSTVKSYIDGFLVDSGSLTLSNTVGTISSIQLGLSSGIRYLSGSIDQVRIFNRALDSGEVTQLYNE